MTTQEIAVSRVLNAIETVKNGGMVIMIDDEDRENEGDLVFAASHVTPEKINFMTKEARGLICLSLDHESVERLRLPMMADAHKSGPSKSTAFTVSIEAREGVSTGISAADRAHTIKVAASPDASHNDIVVPGHIFPLKAKKGGVLERAGHTEGSIDLVKLAGFPPSAVICEIMNDDGTMARVPDLEVFSEKHHIPIVTIADLVAYRLKQEPLIEECQRGSITTEFGTFSSSLFRSKIDGKLHMALTKGLPFTTDQVIDIRVHRQRTLVDVFSHPEKGGRCRIEYGLKMLQESEAGVFLYLQSQEDSALTEHDFNALLDVDWKRDLGKKPWTETDPRMLGVGAQILRHLGVRRMKVHMANPAPLKGLASYDLDVVTTTEIRPV